MIKSLKQIRSLLLSSFHLKVIGLITLLLFSKSYNSQNLIQNGSFEYSTINCSNGLFSSANWIQIQSPDLFRSQCNGNYSIPNNYFGKSYAVSGDSYIGILCFHIQGEYKEYIQHHLNTPLVPNKTYYMSFFASRADGMVLSIKNLGCFISSYQPTVTATPYISETPQILDTGSFLEDTISWIKIEGFFKAVGGEQYVTIGNFNSNIATDTLRSGSLNPIPFEPAQSYYYIDSVSLYDSVDYVMNVRNLENEIKFSVYPNPTEGMVNVECKMINARDSFSIVLHDVLGKEVKALAFEEEIDISDLEKGIYFVSLYDKEQLIGIKKVVKQ